MIIPKGFKTKDQFDSMSITPYIFWKKVLNYEVYIHSVSPIKCEDEIIQNFAAIGKETNNEYVMFAYEGVDNDSIIEKEIEVFLPINFSLKNTNQV